MQRGMILGGIMQFYINHTLCYVDFFIIIFMNAKAMNYINVLQSLLRSIHQLKILSPEK